MALSFDVNLNIGSELGYTMQTNTNMVVNTPQVQTFMNLNGDVFSTSTYSVNTGPLLRTSLVSDFVFPIFTTSTHQTIYMTNIGQSALTVTNILFSYSQEVGPRIYYIVPNILTTSTPITILPNNTASFELAYKASVPGVYDNFIIIKSNNASGIYYKINTHQIAGRSSGFTISPEYSNTTTNHIGKSQLIDYTITPIFNTFPNTSVSLSLVTSLSGSRAWQIDSIGKNLITMKFNPNEVNNVNGTYVSTLTVTANNVTRTITNTGTVAIDYAANKHLTSWLSPASHYNSVIGMSYDIVDNQRVLTIGVGMGGDGVPIYGLGGKPYADVGALSSGADTVIRPYPFWAKVYRIPFTGSEQVYYSSDYVVKTTDDLDYSTYFGEYHAPGSMFIVTDDGYGSLTIEINHLRELSGDAATDVTLNNLTRAFYYYSGVDTLGRYEPLPVEYSVPIASNTATTNLFIGFEYNNRDKVAGINASIVDVPVQ
jgi:hypothetical protein